jgi:cytosine/adenosine deaminase-related metal-dependent hydrolase
MTRRVDEMNESSPNGAPVPVGTMIVHALIVTMDEQRRIISDGAIAFTDDRIVAVGKTADLKSQYVAREVIDGSRFAITPGLINGHIHITGEPLTRGYAPDHIGFGELIFQWLTPVHNAYTPEDEHLAAQYAALDMLRNGTTCFLEAGTIRFLDSAVAGLQEIGIRGRVGQWTWDSVGETGPAATDKAIRGLQDELDRYPMSDSARISAWPVLIGHWTCSDELLRAAKTLADERGVGLSLHMTPVEDDPKWFLANRQCRPVEYLDRVGVLGSNVALTHAVHLDANEVALLGANGATVVHCPTTCLRGAYGATAVGLFPEMVQQGVNLALGTDGNNDSNSSDLMRATFLVAGLFKDARRDPTIFPAEDAFTMATLNGARALRMEDQIGSLVPGKKADLVLHDTFRPEWRPLFNVMNQLVWSADGRSVHSVWVDGVRVVDNYHSTLVDEERLYAQAQEAGRAIIARAGLPDRARWPTL